MSDEFSWDVLMPSRKAELGAVPRRASVCVRTEQAGTEYRSVPVPVGRSLAKIQKSGDALPQTVVQLDALIEAVSTRVARERVVKMLGRRDFSEREVYERLTHEGFSKSLAGKTVASAASSGLISNKRFADAFVRGKVSAGWGMSRIERELSRRGVNAEELEGWPYDYLDPDDEYTRAVEVASRKRVREPNAYAKLVRFLVSRGFSYGVSCSAAKEVLDD